MDAINVLRIRALLLTVFNADERPGRMRGFLIAVFAATLSQPALGQDIGLLLGLSAPSETDSLPARLATEWITYSRGTARKARTLAGLVIPRPSGFWRVAIVRGCAVPDAADPDDLDRVHCYDSLWTAPITQPVPPVIEGWVQPCTTEYYDLHFASPSSIALSSRLWESDCAARSFSDTYRAWVRTYESERPVKFASLGAGASEAYQDAVRRALNVGTALDEPEPQGPTCEAQPLEQHGWRIERDSAQWRAVAFQQQGSELCQLQQAVDWPLPAAVIGYPEPPVDWAVVSRIEPDARQAFTAPGGALLLVVAPDGIRLYAMDAAQQGTRLLALPARTVVMAQWAMGRSVARWTRTLALIK